MRCSLIFAVKNVSRVVPPYNNARTLHSPLSFSFSLSVGKRKNIISRFNIMVLSFHSMIMQSHEVLAIILLFLFSFFLVGVRKIRWNGSEHAFLLLCCVSFIVTLLCQRLNNEPLLHTNAYLTSFPRSLVLSSCPFFVQ